MPYLLVYTSAFKLISRALNCGRNFEETRTAQNIITFCAITFCVTFVYYILRQKLLYFALLLHFVSVITICGVTPVVLHRCKGKKNYRR